MEHDGRRERALARSPAYDALLGYGALAPLVCGDLWVIAGLPWSPVVGYLTVIWGGAILCFLGGVRRGLSFDTPGGAAWGEVAAMLWLFALGAAALALAAGWPVPAIGLLIVGYASLGVADWRAARVREAPIFFGRLRPAQAVIAVASLIVLLVLVVDR